MYDIPAHKQSLFYSRATNTAPPRFLARSLPRQMLLAANKVLMIRPYAVFRTTRYSFWGPEATVHFGALFRCE